MSRKQNHISLTGDRALLNFFNTMPGRMQKGIARKALRKAGKASLAVIRSYAPVDTGRLKKSLKLRAEKFRGSKRKHMIGIKVMTGTRAKLGISPEDKFYYPAALEYGAPHRNIPRDGFMKYGLRDSAGAAFSALRSEISKGIGRAANKTKIESLLERI